MAGGSWGGRMCPPFTCAFRAIWDPSRHEVGMSWASQSGSTFPIQRDTGESKILPKTGLNNSLPVVPPLEISDCSSTEPPLTDHFPEMFALCFPVSHSPLQAVQFVFALHQYRGKFRNSGLWPVLSEGKWKGLFCLREGLFVPAWKCGIMIIMGLNWRIKLVVPGCYTSLDFLGSGVKFSMNGTIYIPWMCWLCHFSVLLSPRSWILGSSISSIWTHAGSALSELPKPLITSQGDLRTCTSLEDSFWWEWLHALSQPLMLDK